MDKMLIPTVSIIRRFHCIYNVHVHVHVHVIVYTCTFIGVYTLDICIHMYIVFTMVYILDMYYNILHVQSS